MIATMVSLVAQLLPAIVCFVVLQFILVVSLYANDPFQELPTTHLRHSSKTEQVIRLERDIANVKAQVQELKEAFDDTVQLLESGQEIEPNQINSLFKVILPDGESKAQSPQEGVKAASPKPPQVKLRAFTGRTGVKMKGRHPVVSREQVAGGDMITASEYPDRPITMEELNNIPLKQVKWSVHPDEAEGELCLRKMDLSKEKLAFIHIGKAAGTTMDSMLGHVRFKSHPSCTGFARQRARTGAELVQVLERTSSCPSCLFCGAHHDFYFLHEIEKLKDTKYLVDHVAPVSWIREPASREESQFHFAQKKTRVIPADFKFSDWIWKMALHPETIKGTNSLFADGSSGVMWFSGTVADNWVNVGVQHANDVWKEQRKRLTEKPLEVLRDAVVNFNKFLWVGIVDEWNDSVSLLEAQGQFKFAEKKSTKANQNKHDRATEAELELLRMAYPMDTAFYHYAKEMLKIKTEFYNEHKTAGTLDKAWCQSNLQALDFKIPFFFDGIQIV